MLMHQTGVNKEGEPFVQLIMDGKVVGQMSTKEARDHALATLEAAEAADQDAFMVDFLHTKIGMEMPAAGRILVEFREWRERTTGVKTGMTVIPDGHSKGSA